MVLKKGFLDFFPFSVDNFLHHLALRGTSFVLGQQWDQEILKYKIRQGHQGSLTHNREHIDKTKHAIETKNSMCSSFQLSTVTLVSSECGCKCVLFYYED